MSNESVLFVFSYLASDSAKVLNSKHHFSQKEICNKAALQLHILYQGTY